MKLSLGFSPCPNDTFIFDALVNKKIDTEGLDFDVVLEDVETLNKWAAEGKLDITKLSFPALFQNLDKYVILNSGAALGKGVGPLLIAKEATSLPDIQNLKIAIPGYNTTANFLLSYALPKAQNRIPFLFSEIEDAVLQNKVDLGLIIHENRFTYRQKGLIKILDLGEFWEEKTGSSIPLGCIAAKKSLEKNIKEKINRLIKKSLEYSFSHYPEVSDYVEQHAQSMDKEVMKQHIDLYVNNFSLNLGEEGKKSIVTLFEIYSGQTGNTHHLSSKLFLI